MKIKALAPWYGGNRMGAAKVGELLAGCEWVGVPFAGGMSELAFIKARTIAVNDVHRHVINLAQCVRCPDDSAALIAACEGIVFHPDDLSAAQYRCRQRETDGTRFMPGINNLPWAVDYFVCSWMGRSAIAGTDGEFNGGLAIRYEAGGGDSAVRFRNATQGIIDWSKVMQRCTFTTDDCFDFLGKCKDKSGHGIYSDAPWPDDGDKYTHGFTEFQHERLAAELAAFNHCRVVVRFGDHPLIRRLYPETAWKWHSVTGRTAANKAKAEVLLVRN